MYYRDKMNKQIIFLLVSFIFFGCQNIEYPKKPKDLIQEDKMVEIMTDIQLFHTAKSYNRNPLQKSGLSPYKFIYEKHNVDSLQFVTSNTYYGSNLKLYGTLYSRVKSILEVEKAKIDTILAKEKRTKDSLKIITDSLRLLKIEKPNDSISKELKKMDVTKKQ
jgi:hypothetical protein